MFELSGPAMPPVRGGAPDALVVLLHGYGADGNDLIALAPHLGQAAPGAQFVSPNAPFPCEMGFGRQWFGASDRSPEAYLGGTRAAAAILDGFLDDQLAALGLEEGRMALVGFSQGTMMALHVAPRRPTACAGVVGYSGRLVAPELLPEEAVSRPPVVLVHGDADEVVPYAAMAEAQNGLEAAEFSVESHSRPGLGHGIDQEALVLGARFLAKVLG
ncbi:MAG: alpha/beta fold hydrolase [Rhodospirillaceae bacterium]|nr:alpha/beta fold hydrolase [Rhodospirillaceae bacterium]MBT6117121.1 alpha/beta fold hydrolase [Rhodospirillaceae bacterium]